MNKGIIFYGCTVLPYQNVCHQSPLIGNLGMSYFSIRLPGGSDGKESTYNAGDLGSIPGLGRSPGEWNGNPLPNSCLENVMDRGTWWAIVQGVTKESRLSD